MYLGVHVSGIKKIYEAPEEARKLGCNTMQIFTRSPLRWREGRLTPADIQEFIQQRALCQIKPVFIHISYLINLASPDPRLYQGSIKAYIDDIKEAEALGAEYIVTHMGSHKETSEQAGLARLTEALRRIIEKTSGSNVGILLENTAGSGSWLGYTFGHQRQIIEGINRNRRVGLCLDTAHAYLAGYNLATEEGLQQLVQEIDREVGLASLKLIHLNDARGELGSHHDQHEHLGKGGIGLAGIKRIVNHPLLREKPFILETPKDTKGADLKNLLLVKKLTRAGGKERRGV
ncbi:MAG: deoxyribonuclease IV [Candidatus Omnitrophica bacterium]|nr:deoxyribonuclease IV [Candidatus Omnitrophota bacterium]